MNDYQIVAISEDNITKIYNNELQVDQIKRLEESLQNTFNGNIRYSKIYYYNREIRTRKESKHLKIDKGETPFKLLLSKMT